MLAQLIFRPQRSLFGQTNCRDELSWEKRVLGHVNGVAECEVLIVVKAFQEKNMEAEKNNGRRLVGPTAFK